MQHTVWNNRYVKIQTKSRRGRKVQGVQSRVHNKCSDSQTSPTFMVFHIKLWLFGFCEVSFLDPVLLNLNTWACYSWVKKNSCRQVGSRTWTASPKELKHSLITFSKEQCYASPLKVSANIKLGTFHPKTHTWTNPTCPVFQKWLPGYAQHLAPVANCVVVLPCLPLGHSSSHLSLWIQPAAKSQIVPSSRHLSNSSSEWCAKFSRPA